MHIAVTGGTGFVGSALTKVLTDNGHRVTILTRNRERKAKQAGVSYVRWLTEGSRPEDEMRDVDVIVNLAGESINSGRWTEKRKMRILQSRLKATDAVLKIIENLEKKPDVLVNASAVGYYGMSETATFTEENRSAADDFLAKVVRQWEEKAAKAVGFGVRTVFARFGVILGESGALPKMIFPYKIGIGGTVGSGRQWLSWVHVEDAVGMIRFAIEQPEVEGPLNVTAPEPKRMRAVGETIGEVMNRPHWLPVPGIAMRAALGEMSSLLLEGQRVLPEKAVQLGYSFRYPELKAALASILRK
jgi:uncharacterized protein (TIGR01777 family)